MNQNKKPVISKRKQAYRRNFYGYYSFPEACSILLYDFIMSFLKPILDVKLSLESNPDLFSYVELDNSSSDSELYLLLTLTCRRKEIGNINIIASAYLYNPQTKTNELKTLNFENAPELMEVMDFAALKCVSIENFRGLIHPNSKIQLKIHYDYMYRGVVRSAVQQTYWRFELDQNNPIEGSLKKTHN